MARIPNESQYRTSEKFKANILYFIEEKDISKNEFAAAAKVNKEIITRATVYSIVPSVRSLIKIADYLNTSISFLMGFSNNMDFYPAKEQSSFLVRLEELVKDKNIKYSTLSNQAPFAGNAICEWKSTGSLPSLDYLKCIADYFNVTIDYLLGRTDYKK